MITKQELQEIKRYLKKSENPLFFYDDDPDGLASYLLLKTVAGKGKGIPIKSSPNLDEIYLRKIKEYTPDCVFILDKPNITQEFVDKANTKIIWIDHHPVVGIKGVKYYNPRLNDKNDNRPTSYWCYKIANEKLWVAMCGIVGDWYVPEFIDKFIKEFPGLTKKTKDAGEMLFTTELGKLVKVFAFILKGKVSDVKRNVSILEKIKTPYEILNQTSAKGKFIHKYYEKINKLFEKMLSEAKRQATRSKLLLYTYPSAKHSLTGILSNELLYTYPNKVIIIGRVKEDMIVMSIRSKKHNVLKILEKALQDVNGYGGGHDHACGAGVMKKDFDKFVHNFKTALKKV
jgi:single-stranded DNA-specific DHH superfamily exonuclease